MKELLIYDEIVTPDDRGFWGFGISADSFRAELARLALQPEDELLVRINSPGGDVDNGLAIYNTLLDERRAGRKVRVIVDGAAHSAASVIAMAADRVVMAETASMLVHDPWAYVGAGNASYLRATADQLDVSKQRLLPAYTQKTGMGEEAVGALMAAETELLPQTALQMKFADEVLAAPARAQALRQWTAETTRHPIARRAVIAQASAKEKRMSGNTGAPPPPAPPTLTRAAALVMLDQKRIPEAVRSWASAQSDEALARYAQEVQPFPAAPGAAGSGTGDSSQPPSPAPLPAKDKPKVTPTVAATARALGVDPEKLAAHRESPWHGGKAEAGEQLDQLLEEAEDEVEAAPVTAAQEKTAAALGVKRQDLENHRKGPWHKGRRNKR